jgi:hypothetical protein
MRSVVHDDDMSATIDIQSMTDDERGILIAEIHEWATGPGAGFVAAQAFERQHRHDMITAKALLAAVKTKLAHERSVREEHPSADTSISDDDLAVDLFGPARPGIYTIAKADGTHRTFKVAIQPSDAKFAPGATVLSYLSGRDNESDYTGMAFISKGQLRPWGKFRSNDELLNDAYRMFSNPAAVMESAHCARCGKTLTTPESIASGFGPECSKKGLR